MPPSLSPVVAPDGPRSKAGPVSATNGGGTPDAERERGPADGSPIESSSTRVDTGRAAPPARPADRQRWLPRVGSATSPSATTPFLSPSSGSDDASGSILGAERGDTPGPSSRPPAPRLRRSLGAALAGTPRFAAALTPAALAFRPLTSDGDGVGPDGGGGLGAAFCCAGRGRPPAEIPFTDILGATAHPASPSGLTLADAGWEVAVHTFVRRPAGGRAGPTALPRTEWRPRTLTLSLTGPDAASAASSWAAAITHRARSSSPDRPASLLVVVNPYGGRAAAAAVWAGVGRPILDAAGCASTELVTRRAGHARDAVAGLTPAELTAYDGIVAVGGDGLFQEVLEGLGDVRARLEALIEARAASVGPAGPPPDPLLASALAAARRLRLGHIPAGSTDAVAFSLHGCRDPAAAALHVALGDRAPLDVMRVTAPLHGPDPGPGPITRSSVCMAAYGYFGDLLAASERLRALGPARYTLAGAAALAAGRTYRATVAWRVPGAGPPVLGGGPCVGPGCAVCADAAAAGGAAARDGGAARPPPPAPGGAAPGPPPVPPGWSHRTDAFKAVLIASLPCRSDQSAHGLAPARHLADGRASLVLVGPCTRPAFLAFLAAIPREGILPGRFPFVQVVEVEEAVVIPEPGARVAGWNCDGEPLPAEAAAGGVGVRVDRGAAQVFARGVEAWGGGAA